MAILILVAFLGAAVVSYYWARGWGRAGKHGGSAVVVKRPVVTPLPPLSKVTIYVPTRSGKGVYLAQVVKSAESKNGPLDAAIEALLAANRESKPPAAVIPPATKLLSPVKVKRGVAEVNFSKQFIEDFSGGSEEEALALNSIVHTLVKNSSGRVRKVRILVEGERAESLGGHFDLTEPISADSTFLKPER
jgi:spore germination protein GerM